jgi:hypothetical protein
MALPENRERFSLSRREKAEVRGNMTPNFRISNHASEFIKVLRLEDSWFLSARR